jgi:hypothetical protein
VTEPMRDEELEAALRDIGTRLDYPAPVAMASAVRARLRTPRRVGWRLVFAPAALTAALLVLVVGALAADLPANAVEFLRVRGIDIFPVPSVPATMPPPTITFSGDRVTLAEARTRVRFAVQVPSAPELGAPDDVYVETVGTTDRLTLVYRQRPGIPVSPTAGVSALVVELGGTIDEALLGKGTGPGTPVEAVNVGGARGYWIEGAPHLFFYRDPSGNAVQETLRLAGNTLVWEHGNVTLRLEAQLTKDQALRFAATFR